LQQIQDLLNVLLIDFDIPNCYLLNIPFATGGNAYLQQSIRDSVNGPSSDLTGYTIGFALVYGSANGEEPDIAKGIHLLFG
jgi:hypothetical protein